MSKMQLGLLLFTVIIFNGCSFTKGTAPNIEGSKIRLINHRYAEYGESTFNMEAPKMKEPKSVHWYIEEQYSEIDFDDFGLIIAGVNSYFAQELAKNLDLSSVESSSRFSGPPQVILQKHNVIITLWKYPQYPHNRRPDPSTLTTLAEVVEDIIATMGEDDRANVRSKTKNELIELNFGWGQGIRNYYQLWHNKPLIKAIGKEHPKDASMVIIEEVWKQLQRTNDKDIRANDYTISLQWHVDKQCLEISWGRGKSIVIAGVKLDFAEAFANELGLHLFQMRTRYQHSDVRPQVTQIGRGVVIKLIKERDNSKDKKISDLRERSIPIYPVRYRKIGKDWKIVLFNEEVELRNGYIVVVNQSFYYVNHNTLIYVCEVSNQQYTNERVIPYLQSKIGGEDLLK